MSLQIDSIYSKLSDKLQKPKYIYLSISEIGNKKRMYYKFNITVWILLTRNVPIECYKEKVNHKFQNNTSNMYVQ